MRAYQNFFPNFAFFLKIRNLLYSKCALSLFHSKMVLVAVKRRGFLAKCILNTKAQYSRGALQAGFRKLQRQFPLLI